MTKKINKLTVCKLLSGCLLLIGSLVFYEVHLRSSAYECREQMKFGMKKPPINRTNFLNDFQTFNIEESNFCLRRNGLKVIAFVHSSISRVKERNETRFTWGQAYKHGLPIAVVFMVGKTKNKREQDTVKMESEKYHDIVQGNYIDSYKLLSYKGLSALTWISKHCTFVPWILHADDDVMVNVFLLNKLINLNYLSKNGFTCELFTRIFPRRRGAWAVPEEEYPCKLYPDYCQGPFWLLPTRLSNNLLIASRYTSLIWVDDVYITGMLAETAKLSVNHIKNLYLDKEIRTNKVKGLAYLVLGEDRFAWWNDIVKYSS